MATTEKVDNIIVPFADIKSAFLAAIEDGTTLDPHQPINTEIYDWHENPTKRSKWAGGSAATTAKNLREGYFAKAFAHSAEYAVLSDKRRFCYDEDDGELDVDRVFDGFDDVYLTRDIHESRPGLRLMMEFTFSWQVSADIIAQYGAWCASLIKSLEASGYDLVIDLWINVDQLFAGEWDRHTNVLIRVKRENEQSNFTEWSALFGKTGWRHLCFLGMCVAGNKVGKRVDGGFGMTLGARDWNVTYDRDNQLVTVNCNQRAGNHLYPVDKLNAAAIEQGLIPHEIKVEV
jgi:hypothetical protein